MLKWQDDVPTRGDMAQPPPEAAVPTRKPRASSRQPRRTVPLGQAEAVQLQIASVTRPTLPPAAPDAGEEPTGRYTQPPSPGDSAHPGDAEAVGGPPEGDTSPSPDDSLASPWAELEQAAGRADWAGVRARSAALAAEPDADPALVVLDGIAAAELGQRPAEDPASLRRAVGAVAKLLRRDPDSATAASMAERLLRAAPAAVPESDDKSNPLATLLAGALLGAGCAWMILWLLA